MISNQNNQANQSTDYLSALCISRNTKSNNLNSNNLNTLRRRRIYFAGLEGVC